jgi:imidazolonepropionase
MYGGGPLPETAPDQRGGGSFITDVAVGLNMEQADLVVTRIGRLLTMMGPDGETKGPRRRDALSHLGEVRDAAVAVKDARVVAVGTIKEIEARFVGSHVLDAGGGVVLPGFVDPHTHPVWAGSRTWELDWKVQGRTYKEITKAGGGIPYTVKETRDASREHLADLCQKRFQQALSLGTTTIEAKSGYGLEEGAEMTQLRAIQDAAGALPLRVVPTFLGLHERPPEHNSDVSSYLEEIRGSTLAKVKEERSAVFVDAFVEEGVFSPDEVRECLLEARRLGFKLRLHVDEFSDLGGARFAVEMGALSADHLLQVSKDGIDALAGSDTVATLLPLVPFAVRDPSYAPAREMIDAGCTVALASDFNPNVPSLSMLQVVQHAVYGMGMRPAEALVAATVNAGCSLDPDAGLGVIAEGHPADLVVTDAKDPVELAYAFGRNPVRSVVCGGQVV